MAAMCRALFGSPDADERRRARQALSGFSIAPQNVPPFLDVLQMTQDPYTLQFVLQRYALILLVCFHISQYTALPSRVFPSPTKRLSFA